MTSLTQNKILAQRLASMHAHGNSNEINVVVDVIVDIDVDVGNNVESPQDHLDIPVLETDSINGDVENKH